jgi:CRISPR/Cas system-associated exonuclease Cas4 (RecB family)
MVEHPDAGGYLEVTVPVYVELNVDAGLVGFSLYGGDSLGHRGSLLGSTFG